ncbi:hypothetical protein IWX90DRAFT_446389 [Phyllosticta citrichinensis]|uniref:Uncharacterized protein n=1 Tax=Phyllosticta citrichinensis TaxID=1130410 RepID=A0ABR1XEZ3_9PEZI
MKRHPRTCNLFFSAPRSVLKFQLLAFLLFPIPVSPWWMRLFHPPATSIHIIVIVIIAIILSPSSVASPRLSFCRGGDGGGGGMHGGDEGCT